MRYLRLLPVLVMPLLSGCLFALLAAPKIAPDDLPGALDQTLGRGLYANQCSTCHSLIDPRALRDDQIGAVVDRYYQKRIINQVEAEGIIDYLRAVNDAGR